MTTTAQVTSWKEDTYQELEGGKLTKATVTQELTGDIEGSTSIDYLMCYAADGTARFIGQQEISATLAGRTGSFVVHSQGSFEGGVAAGTMSVVAGSGTGGLAALAGSGTFKSIDQTTMSMVMEYEFN
jgi:hypothetical protein